MKNRSRARRSPQSSTRTSPIQKFVAFALSQSLIAQSVLPTLSSLAVSGVPMRAIAQQNSAGKNDETIRQVRQDIIEASKLIAAKTPKFEQAELALKSALEKLNSLSREQNTEVRELRRTLTIAITRLKTAQAQSAPAAAPVPPTRANAPTRTNSSSGPQQESNWEDALRAVPELNESLWYLNRAELRNNATPERLTDLFRSKFNANLPDFEKQQVTRVNIANKSGPFGQFVEWMAVDQPSGISKSSAENASLIDANPGAPIDSLAWQIIRSASMSAAASGAASGLLAATPKAPGTTSVVAGVAGAASGLLIHMKMVEQLSNLYGLRFSKVEGEAILGVVVAILRSSVVQWYGANSARKIAEQDVPKLMDGMRSQIDTVNQSIAREMQSREAAKVPRGRFFSWLFSQVATFREVLREVSARNAEAANSRAQQAATATQQQPGPGTAGQTSVQPNTPQGAQSGPRIGGAQGLVSNQAPSAGTNVNRLSPAPISIPNVGSNTPTPSPAPGPSGGGVNIMPAPAPGGATPNVPAAGPTPPPAPVAGPTPPQPKPTPPVVLPKNAVQFAVVGAGFAALEVLMIGWGAKWLLGNIREQMIYKRNESLRTLLSTADLGEGLIKLLIAARSAPDLRSKRVITENPKGPSDQHLRENLTLGEKEEEFVLNVVRSAKICSSIDLSRLKQINDLLDLMIDPTSVWIRQPKAERAVLEARLELARRNLLYACSSASGQRSPSAPWERVFEELQSGQGIPAESLISLRSLELHHRIMIGELVMQMQMLDLDRNPEEREFFQNVVRPALGIEALDSYFTGLEAYIKVRGILKSENSITGYIIHDTPVALPFQFGSGYSGYTNANGPPVPSQ